MAIDPFFGTALTAGAGLLGGLLGQGATDKAIQSQVAGANYAAQLAANQKSLEAAYGVSPVLFGNLFAPGQLERQKQAKRFEFGELGDLQSARRFQDIGRQAAFETSGLGRDAARQAAMFQERIERAKARGALSGIFGPIASDFTS